MRERIANLTSNILNPFAVGFVLIILVSFESTAGIFEALKWTLILIALSILPIYLFTVYLVRKSGLDGVFASVRRQRTKIYTLGVILGAVGYVILLYLKAPLVLLALFVTGFSAAVIFMCINLWWKISLHTAVVAVAVTVLVILYGFMAVVTAGLIPLLAWARVESGHHSVAQVLIGALLAASILLGVFHLFGLV